MHFISTNGKTKPVSFMEATMNGLAGDGGLYFPETIPRLPASFWAEISDYDFQEIAFRMCQLFLGNELEEVRLRTVIRKVLTFKVPLVHVEDGMYVLELFHGPTLAFKDVGARFMAGIFSEMKHKREGVATILVATSGDTGSAVAQGFKNVPGVRVCLLYPKGKVSNLQEKQMTTIGGNITALEVDGTFDDCQKMVKKAFTDQGLNREMILSSANSINIARLLPQAFYYAYGLAQLRKKTDDKPLFSVPSGNFGNLTAGLMAMKMGMPVHRFLAATNINDVIPKYLEDGTYEPRPSVQTISNAMDVGDPSNFARIRHLFENSHKNITRNIWGYSAMDSETEACIRRIYKETGYILDPHTAVGFLAAEKYRAKEDEAEKLPAIVLGTAHPAKFMDIVEPLVERKMELPEQLAHSLEAEKKSIPIGADYAAFKKYLMRYNS